MASVSFDPETMPTPVMGNGARSPGELVGLRTPLSYLIPQAVVRGLGSEDRGAVEEGRGSGDCYRAVAQQQERSMKHG